MGKRTNTSSTKLMTYDEDVKEPNLTILFYIKPWDTDVFDNFLIFVRYIQQKE